jgi:hypothetical protein
MTADLFDIIIIWIDIYFNVSHHGFVIQYFVVPILPL